MDLGAGTGYLAIPAAKMVEGLVFALDIDPSMLEIINAKAKEENVKNIQPIKGSIDHIPLSDDSIDIVLASLVLHEVKPLPKTLQQIKQVLKDDGHFVCVEFEKKGHSSDGSPRISSSMMEQEIINAGLRIKQTGYEWVYEEIYGADFSTLIKAMEEGTF
ncbi:class I SAM-dependent methyltransferase [Lederbergia sp. NSJ-179]|uniref:class I SAM-dependent methyltransferase n=1 Tax=Lederbergia sp. NSJ-179 TaxID=2931402 RepID=UPI001FD3830A|nr:class I SAM-dependent methyltransferase [Lederbergia sp. NSJ-179]MCJ7840731.1 class I SAM-dependent methyltransferase [Lederbergia sp. NSJ-179]